MRSRHRPPSTFGLCTLPSSGWTMKARAGGRAGHSPSWTPFRLLCGLVSLPRSSSTRNGSERLLNRCHAGVHPGRLSLASRGNGCFRSIIAWIVSRHHVTALTPLCCIVTESITVSRWTTHLLCPPRVKMQEYTCWCMCRST